MSELLVAELRTQLSSANARIAELESRLENTARQNEQQCCSIVEDQTELICRYTPNFILTYVNRAYSALFGMNPEEMIGTRFLSQIVEKDRTKAIELISKLNAANPVAISEYRITMPDGALRWLEWKDRAVIGNNNQVEEYQGVGHDITERKNLEAAQEQSTSTIEEMRQILQSTLDVLTSLIAVLAPDGTLVKVNAAWERFSKENDAAIEITEIGTNYLASCDKAQSQDATRMAAGIRAVVSGQQDNFYLEYPWNAGDRRIWFASHVTPFNEPAPRRVVVAHTDITENKEAQENFNNLYTILQQSRDFVAICDLNGKITYINTGGLVLMGYPSPELALDKHITEYHYPDDAKRILEESIPLAVQTGQWRGETRLRTYSGELIEVEQTIFAIHDGEGKLKSYATIMVDMRQQKRAFEALRTSEEKYRSLIESSDSVIAMVDLKGDIIFANTIAASQMQLTPHELLGRNLYELFPPNVAALQLKNIQLVINLGKGMVSEAPIIVLGETRWYRTSMQPVADTNGNIYAALLNSTDITELKLTEEALRQSEIRQRAMLEAIPDLMFRTALDGTFLDYHTPSSDLLAAPREAILGKKPHDVLPPEVAALAQASIEQVIRTKKPAQFEYSLYLKDEILEFEARLALVNNNEVLIIVRDVTERKHAVEALRTSEEKYRSLIESADSIIAMVNIQGEILFINKLAEDYLQFPSGGMVGKHIQELFPPDVIKNVISVYKEVITSGKGTIVEETGIMYGETHWYRASIQPVFDISGTPYAALINSADITTIKQAEAARRESEELFQQLVKHLPGTVFIHDQDNKLKFCNEFYAGLSGYTVEEILGKDLKEYLSPEIYALVLEENALVLSKMQAMEFNYKTPDSKYWFIVKFPIPRQGLPPLIGAIGLDVSKEKEVEKVLKRAHDRLEERVIERTAELEGIKNRLEAIFNHSSDGILLLDVKNGVQQANRTFEKMLGVIPDSYKWLSLSELIHPQDNLTLNTIILEVARSHKAAQLETLARRQDDTFFEAEISLAPVNNSAQPVSNLVCIIRDITERKQAEAVLVEKRQQEQELQQYLKALHEISAELTATPKLDDFCKRVVELGLERLGFERLGFFRFDSKQQLGFGTYGTDAKGNLKDEHHLKFDPADYQDIVKKAMVAPEQYLFDGNISLYGDEGYIGNGWSAAVGLWQGTELLGWLTIDNGIQHKPVTRNNLEVLLLYRTTVAALLVNKLVEEKLLATSQRLELATHTGGIGIWDLNLVDNSLVWDDQMLALFGITREEFSGTNATFQNAVHPDDLERLRAEIDLAKNGGNIFDTEFRVYLPKGGMRYIKANAIIIQDENHKPIRELGVNWDITNLKRSEETLLEALKKEKELGELKSQFVSRASHEFRTPLAAILATVETLTIYRTKMTDAQMDIRLDKIRQQIMFLKDIMEDVLQLSRYQAGKLEFRPAQRDLNELCQNIVNEFESQAENKNRIVYNSTNPPLIATFDIHLIRQVISNLMSNALKYSSTEKSIYLTLSQDSTQVMLKVRDEGIGIPPEDIKNLFEPFQRASNVGTIAGTGLGLSIAQQAVEMHRGIILVESELGVGTTFTLIIPKLIIKAEEDEDYSSN